AWRSLYESPGSGDALRDAVTFAGPDEPRLRPDGHLGNRRRDPLGPGGVLAYFFIGAWVGTILLIALVVVGIVLVVRVIRANELNYLHLTAGPTGYRHTRRTAPSSLETTVGCALSGQRSGLGGSESPRARRARLPRWCSRRWGDFTPSG